MPSYLDTLDQVRSAGASFIIRAKFGSLCPIKEKKISKNGGKMAVSGSSSLPVEIIMLKICTVLVEFM